MTLDDFKSFLYKERQAIDALATMTLILDTSPMRKFWVIFYSFWVGFWTLALLTLPYNPISIVLLVIFLYGIAIILMLEKWSEKEREKPEVVYMQPPKPKSLGVIYIIRREDGVLKIGKTTSLKDRISKHQADYRSRFNIVSSWVVPDMGEYERLALRLSSSFHYSENNRRELRRMSEAELNRFILDFTNRVQKGWM